MKVGKNVKISLKCIVGSCTRRGFIHDVYTNYNLSFIYFEKLLELLR